MPRFQIAHFNLVAAAAQFAMPTADPAVRSLDVDIVATADDNRLAVSDGDGELRARRVGIGNEDEGGGRGNPHKSSFPSTGHKQITAVMQPPCRRLSRQKNDGNLRQRNSLFAVTDTGEKSLAHRYSDGGGWIACSQRVRDQL